MLGSLQTCNSEFASFLRFMTSFMLEGMDLDNIVPNLSTLAQVGMLDACIYGVSATIVRLMFFSLWSLIIQLLHFGIFGMSGRK
jgi:hypothetical protein